MCVEVSIAIFLLGGLVGICLLASWTADSNIITSPAPRSVSKSTFNYMQHACTPYNVRISQQQNLSPHERLRAAQALPPIDNSPLLAQCYEYGELSRTANVLPLGFSQLGPGENPRLRPEDRLYDIPRSLVEPKTSSNEKFKQSYHGFLEMSVPQITKGGVDHVRLMLECDSVERADSAYRAGNCPQARKGGVYEQHPRARRISVHLILKKTCVRASRKLLDAFTAAATYMPPRQYRSTHTVPLHALRFTVTVGCEAAMVLDYFQKESKGCDRLSTQTMKMEDGNEPILLVVWSVVQKESVGVQTAVVARSLNNNVENITIQQLANTFRQSMTEMCTEFNSPMPIEVICRPICEPISTDFYRTQLEEHNRRFVEMCSPPAVSVVGPVVESSKLVSTGLYMRITPHSVARHKADMKSEAIGGHFDVDHILLNEVCSEFAPGILMALAGQKEKAIEFCTQHCRPRLPEPTIKEDLLGLAFATLEIKNLDISPHVSLYGCKGRPGEGIFADSSRTFVGIVQQVYRTYDCKMHSEWCVQPCVSENDLLPCTMSQNGVYKMDRALYATRKLLSIINTMAADGHSLPEADVINNSDRLGSFAATTKLAENFTISEWGTNEDKQFGNPPSSPTNSKNVDVSLSQVGESLFGLSNISAKTRVGDLMARESDQHPKKKSPTKDLCAALAANFGIETSVRDCLEQVTNMIGLPGSSIISVPKRTLNVACGAINVELQVQKRRSPIFFIPSPRGNGILVKKIKIDDVIRALNLSLDVHSPVSTYHESTEKDIPRRLTYVNAVCAAFHSINMEDQNKIEHLKSSKSRRGAKEIIDIGHIKRLDLEMDNLKQCMETITNPPSDPTMTIALIYQACLSENMNMSSQAKFVIFHGRTGCTFHQLCNNAMIEEVNLETVLKCRQRRLLLATSNTDNGCDVHTLTIPVNL